MADISIIIPDKYIDFNPNIKTGVNNHGGGIASKYARFQEAAMQLYDVEVVCDLADITSDVVFLEPLWLVIEKKPNEIAKRLRDFCELKVKHKILCCSEMCIVKFSNIERQALCHAVDIVTTCCDYHRDVFKCIDLYTYRLCDPVPENLFVPKTPKERSVICIGQIGWWKNTEDVIEFFKLIKSKSDIKTIYVGSGGLWAGKSYPFTEELELIISDMADEYVESASAIDVAEIMGSTTFFGHFAYHDTYSESQAEAGLCENVTFGLGHPFLKERTPFRDYDSIQQLVNAMANLTDEEIQTESKIAREIGLKTYSYPVFQSQLSGIVERFLK